MKLKEELSSIPKLSFEKVTQKGKNVLKVIIGLTVLFYYTQWANK